MPPIVTGGAVSGVGVDKIELGIGKPIIMGGSELGVGVVGVGGLIGGGGAVIGGPAIIVRC
jgi:hypothetical protein